MENTELIINNDDTGATMLADLSTAKSSFCSLTASSPKEKIRLFNLINAPEKRLKDMINVPLSITDIYAEIVYCINTDTGEQVPCPRIVLIDNAGVSYQCVSKGIFNALTKLFQIYGMPHWEVPLTITPKLITKGDRSILTFSVGETGKSMK